MIPNSPIQQIAAVNPYKIIICTNHLPNRSTRCLEEAHLTEKIVFKQSRFFKKKKFLFVFCSCYLAGTRNNCFYKHVCLLCVKHSPIKLLKHNYCASSLLSLYIFKGKAHYYVCLPPHISAFLFLSLKWE